MKTTFKGSVNTEDLSKKQSRLPPTKNTGPTHPNLSTFIRQPMSNRSNNSFGANTPSFVVESKARKQSGEDLQSSVNDS